MSWMQTQQRPVKKCNENPLYPVASIFQNIHWESSGATKGPVILACAMICAYDFKTVVEIGLGNDGFTTQMLSKALATNAMEDGLLVSCDICGVKVERTERFTKDLPITHIRLVSDSKQVRWKDHIDKRQIGLAFVDGNHNYESVTADMYGCWDLLQDNGIMIVHDYSANAEPDVFVAVNEFTARYNVAWLYLPENRIAMDYRTAILQKRVIK